ncbi:MAG: S49 family peptidase [Proteobacteria bacterium]|nr:S49 family peptidase [Pseudomonadota bacterium]
MNKAMDALHAALARLPVERFRNPAPVVPVLRLFGPIGAIGGLGRRGLTLARLAPAIERAFSLRNAKAVALSINCPGGSAVQSALIARRIRALADEKKLPVYAFAEDVAASGGYWLACAADEIYADAASIVGSIGVIGGGFGFAGLISRLGVRRRLYTAGERKSLLDPFLPEKPEDVARLRAVLDDVHVQFQAWVRARRGDRLKGLDDEMFSGEFWTGRQALEHGLIDGIDDLRAQMRRRFGENVKLRVVGIERPSWLRLLRGAGPAPAEWMDDLVDAIETRALWARYGL